MRERFILIITALTMVVLGFLGFRHWQSEQPVDRFMGVEMTIEDHAWYTAEVKAVTRAAIAEADLRAKVLGNQRVPVAGIGLRLHIMGLGFIQPDLGTGAYSMPLNNSLYVGLRPDVANYGNAVAHEIGHCILFRSAGYTDADHSDEWFWTEIDRQPHGWQK